MSLYTYLASLLGNTTAQSAPLPGRSAEMGKNHAGGYAFKVGPWTQLDRFLILGTTSGTYYASARAHTQDSLQAVQRCLELDGLRVVTRVVEMSVSGRAVKNTPALVVLALAAKCGDPTVAAAAYQALPKVARTGTHLFQWLSVLKTVGGVSSGTKRALQRWYTQRTVQSTTLQVVKYQSREGWTHADVLRLAKPTGYWPTVHPLAKQDTAPYGDVFQWVTKGVWQDTQAAPDNGTALIWATERAKAIGARVIAAQAITAQAAAAHSSVLSHAAKTKSRTALGQALLAAGTDNMQLPGAKEMESERRANKGMAKELAAKETAARDIAAKEFDRAAHALADLIQAHGLPRECIPTQLLSSTVVWAALLDNGGRGMPLTALLRNLGKMASIGMLEAGSSATHAVVQQLSDREALRRSRIHPLTLLVAMRVYGSGEGVRGSLNWAPTQAILDALDLAFYASFDNVQPTGKRWLLALDVSSSMVCPVAGLPGVTARDASAAMALITARTEQSCAVIGFTSGGQRAYSPDHGTDWCPLGVSELNLSPRRRLDDNVRSISGLPFGGTDCALPMRYALARKLAVDVFVIYTDSETWAGDVHPSVALKTYREQMGINARLIVVGMTSTGFSIADPLDDGMLDVVGMDPAVPKIMAQFAAGEV